MTLQCNVSLIGWAGAFYRAVNLQNTFSIFCWKKCAYFDLLLKTGRLCSGSSTSISVFFRPNSYSCILHVKSIQNMEIPYWLASVHSQNDLCSGIITCLNSKTNKTCCSKFSANVKARQCYIHLVILKFDRQLGSSNVILSVKIHNEHCYIKSCCLEPLLDIIIKYRWVSARKT